MMEMLKRVKEAHLRIMGCTTVWMTELIIRSLIKVLNKFSMINGEI